MTCPRGHTWLETKLGSRSQSNAVLIATSDVTKVSPESQDTMGWALIGEDADLKSDLGLWGLGSCCGREHAGAEQGTHKFPRGCDGP